MPAFRTRCWRRCKGLLLAPNRPICHEGRISPVPSTQRSAAFRLQKRGIGVGVRMGREPSVFGAFLQPKGRAPPSMSQQALRVEDQGSSESERSTLAWSRRRWLAIIALVLVLQLGLILWLEDHSAIQQHRPQEAPTFV